MHEPRERIGVRPNSFRGSILVGAATLLLVGLGLPSSSGASEDPIDDFVAHEMPASGVPGLAYAVVDADSGISLGAYGVARIGGGTEVTPDTPFLAGSISKSFTALAIMQLVEAGQIGLDDPISDYLERFAIPSSEAITIRHLLSHTSGFSTLQGNVSHTDETGGEDELAQRIGTLAEVGPRHEPGDQWEYSNANYQILGRMIEVVSGQDYQSYVTASILEPLGMHDSFVADGKVHDSMATGHRPWFWTKRPLDDNATHRATAPQGGVVASASDLATYLRMMMNGEDDVLSADGKALMMRPASATSPFYGFGWYLDTDTGTVWHSGSSPGVETLATMIPSENRAVVVLVNGGSGTGFGETTQLRNGITAKALGLDYDGEGSRLSQRTLFLSLILLPVLYVVSMIWAWRHRVEIRATSGASGLFSIWFPVATTFGAALVILWLVPNLIGASLATITLFQPDLGLALIAAAVSGVLWALFRLGVAYTR